MQEQKIQALIDKYYPKNRPVRNILTTHSSLVRDKALLVAQRHPELQADIEVLESGALLHDIGIILTKAPGIDCHGSHPYLMHGVLGFEILRDNRFDPIAKIAERHTGAGLSSQEILDQQLPIPVRDMLPVSIEEQIIAFADKFFSKGRDLTREKTIHEIKNEMKAFGEPQVLRFQTWCDQFC
ncbi:HD domain-containing protein [Geofilum rubicundum]|uniref:HDIG domain protein n=1 Tax=Geofilum rubicundum JCM 15548 TaxID=1236989 RepID=A0A0E9LV40_9BACT|nr:HD domain-containing protein [Geofilum rubicundum]GAO29119.1 HDIG domain protein [Geofilum rubicundum JCM 15548]